MTVGEQSRRNPAEDRLDQLDRVVYRNRHVAGPPAVGVLLAVVAIAGWASGWWWAVAALAVLVLAMAADHVLDLPTRREQGYATACWVSGAGWVVVTAWHGPAGWLWVVLALGVLSAAIPWVHHRRVRRGVDVDRAIDAWGDGSSVGLQGTHARGVKAGTGWWSFKLAADRPGMYTLGDFKQRAGRIAAKYGVRAEAVSFTDSDHEGEVQVTVRDTDRATTEPDDDPAEPTSIRSPFRVGATDAGETIEHAFHIDGRGAQHGACVGANGSGKSGLVNKQAEHAARAEDGLLWMVDLSYGAMELKGWAEVCDWFAYTIEQVEAMLDVLPAICQSRGGGSERQHTPSVDAPGIVLLIDESASVWAPELVSAEADAAERRQTQRVAETRRQKVGELLRLARKYGVSVHQATQYGDQDALGGNAAKQQVQAGYASVFRSGADTDGHLLIPAGNGVKCSQFPRSKPGTMAGAGPTIDGTARGRVDWTSDARRDRVVATWRGHQPELEPAAVAAGGDKYRRRNRSAPDGDGGDTDGGDSGESPAQAPSGQVVSPDFTGTRNNTAPDGDSGDNGDTPGRLSPDQSRQLVMDTLAAFGEPASPSRVAEACGRSTRMVSARLGELRERGQVQRLRGGRWQPAGDGNSDTTRRK